MEYNNEPVFYQSEEEARRAQEPRNEKYGFAVASLILASLGLVTACTVFGALVFGIAGIVCGILSITKKECMRPMAIVGIVLSALAILAGIVVVFAIALSYVYFPADLVEETIEETAGRIGSL